MSATPPDLGQGVQALVTGAVIGLLTWVASRRTEKKAAAPSAATPPPAIEPVPLPATQSPDEVLAFMRLLQADNVSLRKKQAENDAWRVKADKLIEEMKTEIQADKADRVRFMDALGRYLSALYRGWAKGGPFPLPEGDDLLVLHDIIPRG